MTLLDFLILRKENHFVGLNVGLDFQTKKSNKTGFYSLFISVLRSFQKGLMLYFYIKFQSDENRKKIDFQLDVLHQENKTSEKRRSSYLLADHCELPVCRDND